MCLFLLIFKFVLALENWRLWVWFTANRFITQNGAKEIIWLAAGSKTYVRLLTFKFLSGNASSVLRRQNHGKQDLDQNSLKMMNLMKNRYHKILESWSCRRQHLSQSWLSRLNLTFRTKSSCSSFLDLAAGSSSESSSSSSHFTFPFGSMSSSCSSSFFTPAVFLAGDYGRVKVDHDNRLDGYGPMGVKVWNRPELNDIPGTQFRGDHNGNWMRNSYYLCKTCLDPVHSDFPTFW